MSDTAQTKSYSPIKRIPYNRVSATIWERQTSDGRLFYTTSFSKSYKDAQSGEWKNSNSFTLAEMSEIPLLINQANEHIQMLNVQNRKNARAHSQQAEAPKQNKIDKQTGLSAERDAAMANVPKPLPTHASQAPARSHAPEQ